MWAIIKAACKILCHIDVYKRQVLPYADVIHLRRNFNSNDLLGDRNEALEPALQLAHTQNEGIISAINSGATLRGILKRTQLANVEKLKDIQENFIKDYLTISNNGGIAVIDNASEYICLLYTSPQNA